LGGSRHLRYYQRPHLEGLALLEARLYAPRDGILVTDSHYAPYFANRRSLLTWEYVDETRHRIACVVDRIERFPELGQGKVLAALRGGEFGVAYFDGRYVIAVRGAATRSNSDVLFAIDHPDRVLEVSDTDHHQGENRRAPGCRQARYWAGRGHKAPADLSHGGTVKLPAGSYEAMVRHCMRAPAKSVRGYAGKMSLHRPDEATPFVEVEAERTEEGRFGWQTIPFTLTEPARIEFRATAGDAEWWLDRVYFRNRADAPQGQMTP